MHKNNTLIVSVLISLIIGFGAGYLSRTSPAQPAVSQNGFTGGSGRMMRGGGSNVGGFLSGTVAKKDSGSMTINTRDGNSHLVFVTPDTTISKSVNGTLDDINTGATVIISGTTNGDGSTSATLVQLRPAAPATPQAQ